VTGTHEGDYLGIAPTGRTVTMTEMAIFRVLKGKIVEQWSSPDLLGLLTQLDAVDMKEDE
jgi:predicted ester cyclase